MEFLSMDNEKSFQHLPNEILENIFAQLPLSDLLLTYTSVCKSWSEIILNPYFLPWKKMYLSIKLRRKTLMAATMLGSNYSKKYRPADDIIDDLIWENELGYLTSFLPSLICYMGKTHGSPEMFEASCDRLNQHRQFKISLKYLEWIPDAIIAKPFNVWHLVTTIIILSEDVWDVHNLIILLLSPPSLFMATDVVEGFYCLACHFLYASRQLDLPIRYHYIVYYALYLYENTWHSPNEGTKSLSRHVGQQSIHNYSYPKKQKSLTHEQAKIVNHDLQNTDLVKIVAFAGTGKTTTLLEFCKIRPHMKFLLVVYNKSVQQFCQKSFPSNTTVRTAHAMAYAQVGRRFGNLRKLDGNLKPIKIVEILGQKPNSGNKYKRAGLVKLTIEKFANSTDHYLSLQHVPLIDKDSAELNDDFRLNVILDDAEKVWEEMILCSQSQRVNMTQDGQLKVWQLKKPKLSGYDVIMIDEGQDMNPTMFDVFLNQDAARIIVGDPFQQIYAFRGATNALQSVQATHTFFLTQSFRFGPEVAFVGHCILETLLNVSTNTLVGGATKDSILADPEEPYNGMQRAYVCRTNLRLYKLALKLCKSDEYKNKRLAFAGGIEKVGLEDVVDIYKMDQISQGYGTPDELEIKNMFIARFPSVDALAQYADNVEDHELQNKISMFRYSGNRTVSDVNLLKSSCSSNSKMAEIVLSTIHKAKGLEWDWVIMADDLLPNGLKEVVESNNVHLQGELNLLYVAVTRAKKRLTLNTAALQALNFSREKLERLVASSPEDQTIPCLQCGIDIAKRNAPLITKVYTLPLTSDQLTLKGGKICDTCNALPIFEIFQNPRRPVGPQCECYVNDNERVARLLLVTGVEAPCPSEFNLEANLVPIRWDKYRKNAS